MYRSTTGQYYVLCANTPTVLQKLLDWQLVPWASSSMRVTKPSSHSRQCSRGQSVVMCDFARRLMGSV